MTEQNQFGQYDFDVCGTAIGQICARIANNDFPGASMNIVRDPKVLGQAFTKYTAGGSSKFSLRLLHFRERGDEQIIQGAVDDAWAMSIGGIAASGFVFGCWLITQNIIFNGLSVPIRLIMEQITLRTEELLMLYQVFGFKPIIFMGGTIQNLPDLIQSAVFNLDVCARAEESDLVTGKVPCHGLSPGDKIYGFASDGQACWEQSPNSGIMADDGFAIAIASLIHADYGQEYPDLVRRGGRYRGKFSVGDKPEILGERSVGQALLSPTRQWAILIRLLIERLKQDGIFYMLHGISLNSIGGATRIGNFGQGIEYEKTMPRPPPIFELIQAESGETWRNMNRAFNCGVGLDVVGENDPRFKAALAEVSEGTGVKLFDLGVCKLSQSGKNRVVLHTKFGDFGDYFI